MPSNISRNINGKDEIAYFGEVPWHGLGTSVDGLMTAAQALETASLDWKVEKRPIYIKYQAVEKLVDGHFATVRMDNGIPLGVVGSRYMPVQNSDALNLLDSIVGTGEAKYEVAGALGDGERVWLLAKIPESLAIAGEEIRPYILLANSHDGKMPLIVQQTAVRVVCANTWAVALRDGNKQFRARHTPFINNKVETAREILGFSHKYFAKMVEEAEKLVKVYPTNNQLEEFFGKLYTVDQKTVHELLANGTVPKGELERHVSYSYDLFRNGLGNKEPNIANSAYALFQGITDYLDHAVVLRKGNTKEQRFDKATFGLNVDVKQKAWDMVMAMAN